MNKKARSNFIRHVLYSFVSAIIFVTILILLINPQIISSSYGKIKEKMNSITYDVNQDTNVVFIDGKPLKIANPQPSAYARFRSITYNGFNYEEDENNDFLIFNLSDASGYLNNKCVKLIVRTFSKDEDLCYQCSNKTEVILTCDIHNFLYNSQKGALIASITVSQGDIYETLGSEQINDQLSNLILENAKEKCDMGDDNYCKLQERLK